MSWNNRKETRIFIEKQKRLRQYYLQNGMTEEQADAILEYDKRQWLNKRNEKEHNVEIIPFPESDSGNRDSIGCDGWICTLEPYLDPFVVGFHDERLNDIWAQSDHLSRHIMLLLAEGKTQKEIGVMIGMSQKGVSKRIKKMKTLKNFKKYEKRF